MAPPPRKGGGGAMIAIIVGGVLAVLLVIVAVVVVVASSSGMSAKERLTAAASSLTTARSLKLKGSFSSGSDNLRGELLVTKGGRASGAITWGGDSVTVLSADDKLFVKASKSYWEGKLTSTASERFLEDGDQWGLVDSSELSVKFEKDLTPSALANEMRKSRNYNIRQTETTVNGRKAYKIGSSLSSFYLSEDDEPELLRYENTSYPRVTADVTVQTSRAATDDIRTMRTTMGELTDAFDAGKSTYNEKPEFVSCSKGGEPCTVAVKVRSSLGGAPSVRIKANFRLTSERGGGKLYGECEATGTVTGVESVRVQCTITGGEWAKSGKKARSVWVSPASMAIGATAADVRALQEGLDAE